MLVQLVIPCRNQTCSQSVFSQPQLGFSLCPEALYPQRGLFKGLILWVQNGLHTHSHPGWLLPQNMLHCLSNITPNVTPERDTTLGCGLPIAEAIIPSLPELKTSLPPFGLHLSFLLRRAGHYKMGGGICNRY